MNNPQANKGWPTLQENALIEIETALKVLARKA